MKPSVSYTPISSGRSNFQIAAGSSKFGQAGYPKLYLFPR